MNIEKVEGRTLAHFVKHNGAVYYVDSAYTFDEGYETMIFETNGKPTMTFWGELTGVDWSGIYTEHYQDEYTMEIKHKYIIKNISEFVRGEENGKEN